MKNIYRTKTENKAFPILKAKQSTCNNAHMDAIYFGVKTHIHDNKRQR